MKGDIRPVCPSSDCDGRLNEIDDGEREECDKCGLTLEECPFCDGTGTREMRNDE